ncbi:MAG: hypothetical protein P4L51_12105 [Puia sp.]|nr:hypothetical protein [Puia sp.]
MNSFRRFVALFLAGAATLAQAHGNVFAADMHPGAVPGADSLLPVAVGYHRQDELIPVIREDGSRYGQADDSRETLIGLLRLSHVRRGALTHRAGYRLFSDLANLSVRLKLYPLAMRCYYKALQYRHPGLLYGFRVPVFLYPDVPGTGEGRELAEAGSNLIGDPGEDWLADSSFYERLSGIDSSRYAGRFTDEGSLCKKAPVESLPVKVSDILASFNDGKEAKSYALILQVKQPLPGRRKAFTHISNVGHMFVTLIKYNADQSVVTRSFGFYPHKTNFFTGTPVHPGSAATFKDDVQHDWDEVLGKFISHRRFYKIIDLLKQYDRLSYNLNRNNCTDFGLSVAALGGIRIADTRGSWPLGKGNNPANAGQSILEGRYQNTDPDYGEPLFTDRCQEPGNVR